MSIKGFCQKCLSNEISVQAEMGTNRLKSASCIDWCHFEKKIIQFDPDRNFHLVAAGPRWTDLGLKPQLNPKFLSWAFDLGRESQLN